MLLTNINYRERIQRHSERTIIIKCKIGVPPQQSKVVTEKLTRENLYQKAIIRRQGNPKNHNYIIFLLLESDARLL